MEWIPLVVVFAIIGTSMWLLHRSDQRYIKQLERELNKTWL